MQAYIEDCRQSALASAQVEPREDAWDMLLKTWNMDLYYGNLHMDCYYFY